MNNNYDQIDDKTTPNKLYNNLLNNNKIKEENFVSNNNIIMSKLKDSVDILKKKKLYNKIIPNKIGNNEKLSRKKTRI